MRNTPFESIATVLLGVAAVLEKMNTFAPVPTVLAVRVVTPVEPLSKSVEVKTVLETFRSVNAPVPTGYVIPGNGLPEREKLIPIRFAQIL
jgi:hypothetical protein